MATLKQCEESHENAAYAEFDRQCEAADKRQAIIDEIIAQKWNDKSFVEEALAEISPLIAEAVMKCESGKEISHAFLGAFVIQAINNYFNDVARMETE
jgi:hypothetical protein